MVRLRVKELAEERSITLAQLHLRANQELRRDVAKGTIAYTTVQKLWENKTQRPDLTVLSAVARALGVKAPDLIEDDRLTQLIAASPNDTTNWATTETLASAN